MSGGEGGLFNTVVELVVGQNATLRYLAVQDLAQDAWNFGSQRAVVDRDGTLEWTTLGFGSGNGKVFLETKLAGPGAHAAVTGAYATRGRQHLDDRGRLLDPLIVAGGHGHDLFLELEQ